MLTGQFILWFLAACSLPEGLLVWAAQAAYRRGGWSRLGHTDEVWMQISEWSVCLFVVLSLNARLVNEG